MTERLPWEEPDLAPTDEEYFQSKDAAPSDAAQDVATFGETDMTDEKPKRGRPPGSKNRTKAADPEPEHVEAEIVEETELPADPPEFTTAEEKGLVSYQPPDHHIVTGMAMLARLDDTEFERAMQAIERGQKRIREFQERAMTRGEDYGTVKGIEKPFLHLPGAEKLGLLYGLAVRQEVDRLTGDGVDSPPLAFHVKSFVHVGSFDGPIVGMGWGESNSWEEKYRYRWESPKCPNCGREGLIKRKTPAAMAGKFNCPSWKDMGGCNAVFEPNDPRIEGGRKKVENDDPHSLAETLIQMAAKRSFVASVRRATGTSGFFTQDPDSPSVKQQSGESGDDTGSGDDVAFTRVDDFGTVEAGGKTEAVSTIQIREIIALSKENDLGEEGIARLLRRVLHIDVNDTKKAISDAVKALTATQAATLIHTIKTGEEPTEEATPGWPPASSEDM